MTSISEWAPMAAITLGMFPVLGVCIRILHPPIPEEAPPVADATGHRRMGRERNLVERMRERQGKASSGAPAAGLTPDADAAFSMWFLECVALPDHPAESDIISVEAWTHSYFRFCDKHSSPRLGREDLHNMMKAYARANSCAMTPGGDFIDGQLVG